MNHTSLPLVRLFRDGVAGLICLTAAGWELLKGGLTDGCSGNSEFLDGWASNRNSYHLPLPAGGGLQP